MRLSGPVIAVVLLSTPLFSQRSSGSGSSSGGSHSSFSGGSSSSSSVSRTSSPSSHTSGVSASSGAAKATVSARSGNAQPKQGGFRTFLRHPLRKSAPNLTLASQHPICTKAPCRVPCSPGISGGKGGCVANSLVSQTCGAGRYWNGGGCATSSLFRRDDCSSLALALREQARQTQYAESLRQNNCAGGAAAQECSELTIKAQGEAARQEALQQQYRACRAASYGDHSYTAYFRELSFE